MSDQNLPDQNKSNQNMNAQPETESDQIALDDATFDNLVVTKSVRIGVPNTGTSEPQNGLYVVAPGGFPNNVPILAQSVSTFFGARDSGGIDRFAINLDKDGNSYPVDFYDRYDGTWRRSISLKLGNVGIGTNNPLSMLHIGDGLPTPPSGGYRPWMVRGTQVSWDSDNVFFGLKNEDPDRKDAVIAWGDNRNSDVFRFIFTATGGPADGQEIMRLQPNGNVGIGTINPEAKLHISDPSFRGNMKLFATSGVGHDFGYDGGIDNFFAFAHYGLESGQTKFVWHENEAATRDLLTIKNTGNIGIGTADPSLNQTQLHVEGKLIYSGGSLGGLSFGDRGTSGFVESPTKGERWAWYSSEGTARLWSGGDKLSVNANGNVGIGTTNPRSMLHIGDGLPTPPSGGYRPWMVRGTLVSEDTDNVFFGLKDEGPDRKDAVIAWGDNTDDAFRFIFTATGGPDNGQEIMRLQPNGNVGIGTTNPTGKLQIEDGSAPDSKIMFGSSQGGAHHLSSKRDIVFNSDNPFGTERGCFYFRKTTFDNLASHRNLVVITEAGDLKATGDVYANGILLTSSRELKENIAELSGKEAVEALKNLNPVKFNFKADSDKNRHIGFIAEDVPELVATSDRKTLSPMDIVAVLTQALKEQQNTISALAEKVKLLEAKTA